MSPQSPHEQTPPRPAQSSPAELDAAPVHGHGHGHGHACAPSVPEHSVRLAIELPASSGPDRTARPGEDAAVGRGRGGGTGEDGKGGCEQQQQQQQQQANPWPYHGPAFGLDGRGLTGTIYGNGGDEEEKQAEHVRGARTEVRCLTWTLADGDDDVAAHAASSVPSRPYKPYRPPAGHGMCARPVSPEDAGAAPHNFYQPLRPGPDGQSPSSSPGPSSSTPRPAPRSAPSPAVPGSTQGAHLLASAHQPAAVTATSPEPDHLQHPVQPAAAQALLSAPASSSSPCRTHHGPTSAPSSSSSSSSLPSPQPASPQPQYDPGPRASPGCGPPCSPPPAYSFPDPGLPDSQPAVCQHQSLPPYSPSRISSAQLACATDSSSSSNVKNNNNGSTSDSINATVPPEISCPQDASPPPLPPRRPHASPYGGFGAGPANAASYPPPPKINYIPQAPPAHPPRPLLGSSTLTHAGNLLFSASSAKKWLDKTSHVLESRLDAVLLGPASASASAPAPAPTSRPAHRSPPPGPGAGQAPRGQGLYPGWKGP
ncbi:hypothetical protein E4U54_005918 [Claviceps lovelessii]|nr:hypothetical protein E4U54_005918 [Claviceps lovelessii]